MRGQNIQLLQYLLGFDQAPQQQNRGGVPGLLQRAMGPQAASPWVPSSDPGQRLQNVFGTLAPQGLQQFLSQPTPEQRALDTSMPALQEILTPGANNPLLDRDLALANQQGNRFGSANEILRGQALGNLFNLRTQAANTLGVLGSQAGQGQQRQAGFMDLETQRRLQLLMSLLGTSQGASFNLPFVQQPSGLDVLGQLGGTALGFATGGLFGGNPGGGPMAPGPINTQPRGS